MAVLFRLFCALLLALCTVTPSHAACTTAADCYDGNDCTNDLCDPADGCLNTPTAECGPRVDHPVSGKKIKIHIPPRAPDQEGVRLLHTGGGIDTSNLPVPETPGDPTFYGGSIRFFSTAGGFDVTYRLPEDHWDYFPMFNAAEYRGYQYKDKSNLAGPIGMLKIIGGKTMKLKGKGPKFQIPLLGNPDPVHVILSVGNRRYCMSFGGERKNHIAGKIFWAKLAEPTTGCPCRVNAECDDGLATNGDEVCEAGYCGTAATTITTTLAPTTSSTTSSTTATTLAPTTTTEPPPTTTTTIP